MKRKWKITLLILVPLLALAGVAAGLKWTQKDLVTVQTAVAGRADLTAQVTASGETNWKKIAKDLTAGPIPGGKRIFFQKQIVFEHCFY